MEERYEPVAEFPGAGNVYKSMMFYHLNMELSPDLCYYCTI